MPFASSATEVTESFARFTPVNQPLNLQPYLEILPDINREYSFDDVLTDELSHQFKPVSVTGNSFGFTKSAYWVRFSVFIDEIPNDTVLLELAYPLLDNVSLYIADANGNYSEKATGDALPFSTRDIDYRNFIFILPRHSGEARTYYMRIQSEGSTQIVLSLSTAATFIEKADHSNLVLGIYYGIMLLLILSAFVTFAFIRDTLFFYYAFYLLVYLVFQLSLNGLSYQFLWPDYPQFTSRVTAALVGMVVIAGILFSGSFLQVWENKYPRIKRLFYVLVSIAGISVLLSIFGDYAIGVQLASASGLLLPPVILIAAIWSVYSGYKPARYFLVAWGVFLFGVLMAGLLYGGYLPHSFFTYHSIQIGSLVEVLLLGYALIERIGASRNVKSKAIESANAYISQLYDGLEVKVQERTQQLSESEAQLRTLIETMPDLVWWKDPEGVFMGCNPKFERLMGVTQDNIIGKTDYDFFDKEQADFFREKDNIAIEAGEACVNEEEAVYADDNHTELLETIKMPMYGPDNELVGTLGVGRDITERRSFERALMNTQKMEAIGQLSGGIAHDFNNILAIIIGNLSLLKNQLFNKEKSLERIETIEKSANRAAHLTKQLLGFSRSKAELNTVTNINKLMTGMDNLVVRSVTPQVVVEQLLEKNLWFTKIDQGDFQDAIINLVLNARDAMTGGGKLVLQTTNCILDEEFCESNPGMAPGEFVVLSVSDTGEGILPELQERIFEPFFTTKEQGKGTGLGLAMVFGFVSRSNGFIKVESEINIGSVVKIYLPRCLEELPPEKEPEQQAESMPGGQETILVVDDEEALLELAKDTLEVLNYRVLTAISGKQALEVLAEEANVDMIISDVLMPGGMNGYELIELATAKYPEIKVLLASGYTEKIGSKYSASKYTENLLLKPYQLSEFAKRVRQTLDA